MHGPAGALSTTRKKERTKGSAVAREGKEAACHGEMALVFHSL